MKLIQGLCVAGLITLLVTATLFGSAAAPDENENWWDGFGPWPLGQGMNGDVHSLTVYNDELYAGGYFSNAGPSPVNFVARWDGSSWSPLGLGVNGAVRTLGVYGGELIVSGDFTLPYASIARWNGSSWQSLEDGWNHRVESMTI